MASFSELLGESAGSPTEPRESFAQLLEPAPAAQESGMSFADLVADPEPPTPSPEGEAMRERMATAAELPAGTAFTAGETVRNIGRDVLRAPAELAKGIVRGGKDVVAGVGDIAARQLETRGITPSVPGASLVPEALRSQVMPIAPLEFVADVEKAITENVPALKAFKKKAVRSIREWAKGWRKQPEQEQLEWAENPLAKAASVVGQGAPLFGAAVAASIATKSPVPAAILFGSIEGAGTYEAARAAGKTVDRAQVFANLNQAWNIVSEGIPFEGMLGRAGKKAIERIVKGSVTEGVQELIQTMGSNLVEKVGFDPARNIMEGWLESLVGGAGLGAAGGAAIRGGVDVEGPQQVGPTGEPLGLLGRARVALEGGAEPLIGRGGVAAPEPATEQAAQTQPSQATPAEVLTTPPPLPIGPQEDVVTAEQVAEREAEMQAREAAIAPPVEAATPALDGAVGQQPRKFGKRIAASEDLDPAIREGLSDPEYVPISNDITVEEADAVIQAKGVDAAAQMAANENNALQPRVRNVIAQRLIRQYNEDASVAREAGDAQSANTALDKALGVADHIVEWGTRMGQGIQAFAIWNKLSPEGALRQAQRAVQKRNKGKPAAQQVKMTPEQAARIQELAEQVQAAPEGFQQNEKVVEMLTAIDKIAGKPSKGDVLASLWYANILSGYSTHQRNVIDTAINVVFDVMANAVANRQNPFRALGTMLGGIVARGGPEALGTMRTGVPTARTDVKLEGQTALETNPFKGLAKPLNWWKFVGRAMQAEDALFFKGAQEARAEILARNIARKEGLRGDALTARVDEILGNTRQQLEQFEAQADSEGLKGARKRRRVNELMEQNRPDDLLERSTAFAGRATYNYNPVGALGIIARKVGEITRDVPALKPVAPFTRIVANVTNRSLDYTPWGFKRAFLGQTQELSARQQELKAERLAKAAVGSLAVAMVYALDAVGDEEDPNSFQITAKGPSDPKVRNQLREIGWKPYTVRVGGRYYSYMLTPFAIPFAIVGGIRDAERYRKLDQKDMLTRIQAAVVLSGEAILNQSFLSGVADVLGIFGGYAGEGQIKSMQRFFGRAAGGAIPNLLRQIDKVFDPTVMENATLQEALWREIPFARRSGRPKINMLGEPVRAPQSIILAPKRGDHVWRLLAEKEAWVPIPSRQTKLRVGREGRYMEPNEYYDYIKISGRELRKRIEGNFDGLQDMDKEQAQKWVKKQTDITRQFAKRRLEQRARQ